MFSGGRERVRWEQLGYNIASKNMHLAWLSKRDIK